MVLDLVNLTAGAYKGYMNAGGNEVGSEYLVATVAVTSLLKGVQSYFNCVKMDNDPKMEFAIRLREKRTGNKVELPSAKMSGVQKGVRSVPIGAFEVMVGFGVGYLAYKVMN